ncbi:hypothetical protein HNQ07_004315 [Deinococcus metalli]|uniref:Uncharacterized protein n=1 Tax=Deinococcus metalli TaxID=1141878 RepID=A0A7W8KJ97_9DEIO|nr:hypothetical protein [Deinococcus metalli]MBB5378808.1 hypothetical protein [Deinococcus metalli]GHF60615.1 hypothetical protein GCM10017781_41030 [Deinococcus metalli]
MTRFLEYTLREQAGDVLVFEDITGHERRVAFKILDVSRPGTPPLYGVHLTSGAWLALDHAGQFRPLNLTPQRNEIDALTLFLSFVRRAGVLYDQTDQVAV